MYIEKIFINMIAKKSAILYKKVYNKNINNFKIDYFSKTININDIIIKINMFNLQINGINKDAFFYDFKYKLDNKYICKYKKLKYKYIFTRKEDAYLFIDLLKDNNINYYIYNKNTILTEYDAKKLLFELDKILNGRLIPIQKGIFLPDFKKIYEYTKDKYKYSLIFNESFL